MKYLKFLIINILVFGALLFGISLLFPPKNAISKSVNVTGSKQTCQNIITDTSGWKNWNRLAFQQSVKSKTSTVHTDTTLSVEYGNSSNLITDVFEIYTADSLQSVVTWKKTEKLPWYAPFKKFRAMVMNKTIAAEMDSSLNLLKEIIEKRN